METKVKKTEKLTLFGPRDGVFKRDAKGAITVDLALVRERAELTPLPRLGRFYTDVRPQVYNVLAAVDEVFIHRMTEREQDLLPIADDDGVPTGQELKLKPTFTKHKVDEGLLIKAEERLKADGYPMVLIKRERSLVLDKVTMKAFGITEAKLRQFQDKIRVTSERKDVRALKKAAKTGGVGGDIIKRAITTQTGRLAVYVNTPKAKAEPKDGSDLGGS